MPSTSPKSSLTWQSPGEEGGLVHVESQQRELEELIFKGSRPEQLDMFIFW